MSEEKKRGRPANNFVSKEEVVKVLEESFNKFLSSMEEKLKDSGNKIQGLGKWMELQLKTLERRILADNVGITSHDMAIVSLIELLESKNILLEGEFKERLNKKMDEKVSAIESKK